MTTTHTDGGQPGTRPGRLDATRAAMVAARDRLFRTRMQRRAAAIGAAVLAAVLVAGGVLLYQAGHAGTRVTAYFDETIGIYPGSDVRVLGVRVGAVDAVQPDGGQVRVVMTLDHGVVVPASAKAVVVAPSVVADRYVQLTPAYTGGPRLASGAVIPVSRTAVPAEVDQIYASLNKLATALGPSGANRTGALSKLIRTGAANLGGNGRQLGAMITQFSGLSRALGGSAGNLGATLTYLQQFTSMLKNNDGQVRQAEQQLAEVSGFLAGDRQDLAAALNELATALGQVRGFIAGNRGLIKSNVGKLASITGLLVRERASLAEALDTAPLAVDNVLNAYDATHRTLDGRGDLNELTMGPGAAQLGAAQLGMLGSVPVPRSDLAALPPLPLPVAGQLYATPQAILAGGR